MTDSEMFTTSMWLQKVKQGRNNKLYKILIVDDQPEIRNLLAITLDADNYEVHHANDWMSALGMTRAIKPDLILLDIMMPGEFDGLEVCRRIKCDQDLSSTIVLVVSARAQVADRYKALEVGADDYLTKPFSPLALMEKVSLLLSKKEQQRP
jgi:DNA-binding response OmpR family regulator